MIRFSASSSSFPKKQFIGRLAAKMNVSEKEAGEWLEAVADTLHETFEGGQGVILTGFGNFYLSERRNSTAFQLNPSQKLRKLLVCSSSYKGNV